MFRCRHTASLGTAALALLITMMPASIQRAHAAYPGANGLIAYSAGTGDETSIHVMAANGTGAKELTNNGRNDFYPSFSPDGTKIAYQTHDGGNADIYTVDLFGNETQLTTSKAPETVPSWSPDGNWILFEKKVNGNTDIYAMAPVANGKTVRLTTGRGEDIRPAWSPDGTKISYMSDRDGDFEIYTLDINPSTLIVGTTTQLTFNNFDDGSPDWSPLGTKLVYASYGTSVRGAQLDIFVMNVDGSGISQLTTRPGVDNSPDWSPDGASILFTSNRGSSTDIFIMPVAGESSTPATGLTDSPVDEQSPDWQSAGSL